MKKYKIYLSSSTQEHNIGVGAYGTEEENMFILTDLIHNMLKEYSQFEITRNNEAMSLTDTIHHINSGDYDVVIDNHSNAGGFTAEGTEIFSFRGNKDGLVLANCLYNYISEVSPGIDRGLKTGNHLGFVKKTKFTAVLIEHFFHTNTKEVEHFLQNVKEYAVAEVKGICDYFNVEYKPFGVTETREDLVNQVIVKCDEIQTIMRKIEVIDNA